MEKWKWHSRNFVVTRTPTQVASHAQKYFIRSKLNEQRQKDDQAFMTLQCWRRRCLNATRTDHWSEQQHPPPVLLLLLEEETNQSSKPPPTTTWTFLCMETPTVGQPVGGPLVSRAVGKHCEPPSSSSWLMESMLLQSLLSGSWCTNEQAQMPLHHAEEHQLLIGNVENALC
ncbi:Myb-like protein J [Raphanus sativus]|nr:Myb-like protein J [Raphanus sativus]